MNQQHKITPWLGLGALFAPAVGSAHTRPGDESALTQLLHTLLHAVQGPAAITTLSIGVILVLLVYHHQRGDRS